MTDSVRISFPLRTSSAESFDQLIAKGKRHPQTFIRDVLNWYANLVTKFNAGCDTLEMKQNETGCYHVDLFDEAARAQTVDILHPEFDPENAEFLKAKFNTTNLSNILMNAFYSFDRALDAEARDSVLVAVNPAEVSPVPVIYSLQTKLVQKGPA